jgi:hypothetical protein
MKAGSTATSLKRRGQARNGAIVTHHNPQKFRTPASPGKVMLTLSWDHQVPLAAEKCTSERPQSPVSHVPVSVSLGITWDQPSDQNIVDCSVPVSYCWMWTPETIGRIRVSPSSIVPARLRSLWLPFPWVTQGGSWWKDFSIPWRGAGGGESGYACSQEISFTRNPGISEVLSAIWATLKNGKVVPNLFALN